MVDQRALMVVGAGRDTQGRRIPEDRDAPGGHDITRWLLTAAREDTQIAQGLTR